MEMDTCVACACGPAAVRTERTANSSSGRGKGPGKGGRPAPFALIHALPPFACRLLPKDVAGNGRKWQGLFGCARDRRGSAPVPGATERSWWLLPTLVENKGFHWVRLARFYFLAACISAWRAGFRRPLGRAGPDSSRQDRGFALVRRFSPDSPIRPPCPQDNAQGKLLRVFGWLSC